MGERKAALVTGSTSGIGLAVATAFAKAGMDVMLNGLGDAAEIEKLRAGLEHDAGVAVKFDGANLMDANAAAGLVESTVGAFGKVDVIVNNAGMQFVSPVEDFPVDKWNAIIALNLSAAFHTTRAAFAGMKQRRYGRIINICSAHAHVASPFKSAYVAAKHGLLGFTKTIALEGATFNIRANGISPGYVHTPLVENQIPDTMKARNMTREQVINDVLLAAQPTKEFVKAEDIAGLALFLLSDAANQINGASLNIDGGWTAA
ncbi:3-hydroxybutyrate dehydrogenase [Terricaulis sp.]|uniref:3-hydroxybutyrate dehydrogenase n=1 Tax=Terricaulis sp. TaxID=2768686 RepID=UPI00378403C7